MTEPQREPSAQSPVRGTWLRDGVPVATFPEVGVYVAGVADVGTTISFRQEPTDAEHEDKPPTKDGLHLLRVHRSITGIQAENAFVHVKMQDDQSFALSIRMPKTVDGGGYHASWHHFSIRSARPISIVAVSDDPEGRVLHV